jgi:hypothetical protein
MNKLAIFVEGHTEVVFIARLIEEIAGKNKVLIEHREIRGGTTTRRTFGVVRAVQPDANHKYFVLIVDCAGDRQVKARILEEHENLTRAGYSKIIGLRDVRPEYTYEEVGRLEAGLPKYIKSSLVPVEFVLAVMEIEAWFLAETSHFARIDSGIKLAAVPLLLGFDPETDDLEQRATPAADLANCYALGGKAYQKDSALATVEALDYARVYLHVRSRFRYLDRLIGSIEAFLAL